MIDVLSLATDACISTEPTYGNQQERFDQLKQRSVFPTGTPTASRINGLPWGELMVLSHGDVARIGLMQDLPHDASGSREAAASDKPGPTCKMQTLVETQVAKKELSCNANSVLNEQHNLTLSQQNPTPNPVVMAKLGHDNPHKVP